MRHSKPGSVFFISMIIFGSCLLICLSACDSSPTEPERQTWNLPSPQATGIEPETGDFDFSASGRFAVIEGASGKEIRFTIDTFRFDMFPVNEGAFSFIHGEIAGTHCPTDSYAISGSFVSPTRAEGTIKYARSCRITRETSFVASSAP